MQAIIRIESEFKGFFKYLYGSARPLIVCAVATLAMLVIASPNIRVLLVLDALPYNLDALLVYGAMPLACLFLLNQSSRKFKLNDAVLAVGMGDMRFWLPASALYLLVAIPITLLSTQADSIGSYYHGDIHWPSYLVSTALYMLGWEYLFRGFLIEGLREKYKEGAIVLQMIPFTLLHLGKPDAETLSCIVSGVVWGYICYRARSFWPAFFMHMAVNITVHMA